MSDLIQDVTTLDVATDAEVIAGAAQYFENLAAADAYPDRPRARFRHRLAARMREIAGRVAASSVVRARVGGAEDRGSSQSERQVKRGRMVTELTNSVASNMNQTWPEDRHGFKLIRNAIEQQLPKGDVVVVLTRAQADALSAAANYRLEMAGEGDHSNIVGSHADALNRAVRALRES